MNKRCYINSIAQISCQLPLTDEWIESPRIPDAAYVRAQEPDYKGVISPAEARRMSRILKRTIRTSAEALQRASISMPDAIITGTGMGCMENSEKFLSDIAKFGENCLKPTLFMQSTHNTISSQIAISLKCHGYNNTYSHTGISFESALLDARLRILAGSERNVLVGAHDEVTPLMSSVMRHTHPEFNIISEASVATVISDSPVPESLCELSDVKILHCPRLSDLASLLSPDSDPVVLTGINGNPVNDADYLTLFDMLGFNPLILRYRNVFGDCFTSSALGFYAAATMISKQTIPAFAFSEPADTAADNQIEKITLLNKSDSSDWSIIRLKRI